MIKANDLRIGNYIKEGDYELKIGVIDSHYHSIKILGSARNIAIEECNPIPLTEEWLVKLGFAKDLSGWQNVIRIEFVPEMNCYWLDVDGNDYLQGSPIRYVHQLQNLYFALTGEELTISEK